MISQNPYVLHYPPGNSIRAYLERDICGKWPPCNYGLWDPFTTEVKRQIFVLLFPVRKLFVKLNQLLSSSVCFLP